MSLFAPWRSPTIEGISSRSPSASPSSSPNAATSKAQMTEPQGPVTAPGGWSSLMTWRPRGRQWGTLSPSSSDTSFVDAQEGPTTSTIKGNRLHDAQEGVHDLAQGRNVDREEDEDEEAKLFTARTRQWSGKSNRQRAPIPFDLDRSGPPRTKARSGTVSSVASSTASGGRKGEQYYTAWHNIPSSSSYDQELSGLGIGGAEEGSANSRGLDSANVSAELLSSMAWGGGGSRMTGVKAAGVGGGGATAGRRSTRLRQESYPPVIDNGPDDISMVDTAMGDMSLEVGALDTAVETLSRIRARDVATAAHPSGLVTTQQGGATPLSNSSNGPSPLTGYSTTSSSSPTIAKAYNPRKPSFGNYSTPQESPTNPANASWMQWGTSKIRATMPRGIASALLAVMTANEADGNDFDGTWKNGRVKTVSEESSPVDDFHEDGSPRLIQDCIQAICGGDEGMQQQDSLLTLEGIFRISPSNALLRSTRDAYAQGQAPDMQQLAQQDRHLPAALLKDNLRSLRPPVFPSDLYDRIAACPLDREAPQGEETAITYIRETLLPSLREDRQEVLRKVMGCASQVAQHHEQNRMDAANLAVVMTPNLVHGEDVMRDVAMCAMTGGAEEGTNTTLGDIVKLCIERYEDVFVDEKEEDGTGQGNEEEDEKGEEGEKREE